MRRRAENCSGWAWGAIAALLLAPGAGFAQDGAPPPGDAAPPATEEPTDAEPADAAAAEAATEAPVAPASVGPVPVPAKLILEDAPNDSGFELVFRFPKAANESTDYVYRLLLSPSKDGLFLPAARVDSTEGLAKDLIGSYGGRAKGMSGHAVVVLPLALFSPDHFAKAILPGGVDRDGMIAEAVETRLLAILGKAPFDVFQNVFAEAIAEREKARLLAALGEETFEAVQNVFADANIKTAKDNSGHVRDGYFGTDKKINRLIIDRTWYGKLEVLRDDQVVGALATIVEATPSTNLFNWKKLNNLGVALILGALVMFFIQRARKNPDIYLRRIGGLDAVDDALGRATEMGKPVLFVHGLREMKEVSTIAAVNILGEIAKHTAEFDTKLLCANYDAIVLGVSQETVRESYTSAGRPDAFQEDNVFLAGGDQFSYVAAVDGIMLREEPAANFYCGYFYAESLILAETGAQSGAIQIAATDSFTQLPFFITTCDYTLMGEELYAASAYLSRDPLLLGSLKGQDYAKLLMIVLVVAGIALETFGIHGLRDLIKPY